MDDKIHQLEIEFSTFEATITSFMNETKDHRRDLHNKLDKLCDKLDKLPCERQKGIITNLGLQLKLLWGIISACIVAVLTTIFRR